MSKLKLRSNESTKHLQYIRRVILTKNMKLRIRQAWAMQSIWGRKFVEGIAWKKLDAKRLEVCWRLEKAALCTGTSAGRAAVSTSNRAVTAEASVAIAICKWCLQGNGGTVPQGCVRDFTCIPPASTHSGEDSPEGCSRLEAGPLRAGPPRASPAARTAWSLGMRESAVVQFALIASNLHVKVL